MDSRKKIFNDEFFQWLLRGVLTGLVFVAYNEIQSFRAEFSQRGTDIELLKLEIKNLKEKSLKGK